MRRVCKKHQVRIIAGKWRGRKVIFPDLPQIRPTPDRVRETLFNWLMDKIRDTDCLDLFAGSGIIGFEALSRGARHVVMIDSSPMVIELLYDNKRRLAANNLEIHQASVPINAPVNFGPFDIVFLDPPFSSELIATCIQWL